MKITLHSMQHVGLALLLLGLSPAQGQAQDLATAHLRTTPPATDQQATYSLKDALQEIHTRYKVDFAYQENLIAGKRVRVAHLGSSLDETLETMLVPLGLTYKRIDSSFYAIVKKPAPAQRTDYSARSFPIFFASTRKSDLFFDSFATTPQDVTVTGRVVSNTGEGLPGVSVVVKGTTIGTSTDVEGRYSLSVPNGNVTIVFSYIGFASQEVALNNRSALNVTMAPDTKSLQEVVVVGYGTVNKSDLTGSVASVSAEEIRSVPVQSVTQAMQGRAAGVDIAQGNFRPGENPTIRIRGNRSLNASNNPLFVLDGIPLAEGSSINDFNPADIASIEVLKDASATAIYGSRGANGVILVTTKKGVAGQAKVTYDGYVGASGPLTKVEMMDGAQHAELKREAQRNNSNKAYLYPYANPAADFDLFKVDPLMWQSVAAGYEWEDEANRVPKYRPVTDQEREMFRQYYEQDLIRYKNSPAVLARLVDPNSITEVPVFHPDRVRNTDWVDMMLRTGFKQDHQVSVSGGGENLTAIFSGGYYSETGIQKTQSFERFNAKLGVDFKVSDRIRIGGSTFANLGLQQYGSDMYGLALGQLPIAVPYNEEGFLVQQPGGDPLIYNPLYNLEGATDERRTSRIMGSYYGEVQLLEGLRFRMNFGPDLRHHRRGQFYSSTSNERRGGPAQGNYDQNQNFTYVLENLLFYDKELNENHSIGVTLLQSVQQDRYETTNIQVRDLPYDSQLFYNLGSTNGAGPDAFGSDFTERKLMSWMGRVNYNLLNKYLFTATGRYDGSSVLAPGRKWDFFPSFAVAWKLQEESFMQAATFVSELKLRAGYGKTGNSAVNPYVVPGRLVKTRYAWGNNAAWGFQPDLIPNPDLKWEATHQVDIGLDFGLWNNRLTGSLDLYDQRTNDLIMDRQLPTASGFSNIQQNIGATRNRGVELSLNSVNVETTGGFTWSTNLILARNKEEITELFGGQRDDLANRWFIGHPVFSYYDLKTDGIWQTNEAALAAEYGRIPGQNRVVDVNGDKKIDASDRMILGSNVPDWTGSLINNIGYKGLELSFFFFTRQGQMIRSGWYRPSLAGRYPERAGINYWTPANPSNEYPRPTQDQERLDYPEAYLHTDGSFVKLRNVSLSYDIPQAVASSLRMSNLRVYVTAFNPFLWTNFEAGDPEFSSSSRTLDDHNVSNNLSDRSLVFGVRLGF